MWVCIGLGIIISAYSIWQGKGIELEWSFLLIVLISLVMNKIAVQITCLAYVVSLIYMLDYFLVFCSIKEAFFDLRYEKLIILVGGLHLVEGILTFFFARENTVPVMTYKGEKLAGGYQAYGKWLIPLLIFSIDGLYIPIMSAVVYCNESYVYSQTKKSKIMGMVIASYGMVIMLIAHLVRIRMLGLTVGILSMPLLHEIVFAIDYWIENTKPLRYAFPERGIRVMELVGSETLGIERGDIIISINEKQIIRERDYYLELNETGKFASLAICKLDGQMVEAVYSKEDLIASKIIFLPPF